MLPQRPQRASAARVSRRTLLSTVGTACAAAAIAACGPQSPGQEGQAAGAPGDVEQSAPTTDSDGVPSPRKLTDTAAVPVGGGTVVSGILVVQPLAGLFKAFDARCPHLGAQVSPPVDGVITCRQHNSQFLDIDGSLLDGPAPRGLREVHIEIDGGSIMTV